MFLRLFLRFLVALAAVWMAACSDGDGPDTVETKPYTLSGVVANGPLDGATVAVFSTDGTRLGSTQTDGQGAYSLKIDNAPPYRVSTSGGQYSGQTYSGSLQAWCNERVAEREVRCDLTPLSTVARLLMDRGYSNDETEALLEQRYSQTDDPFTRELRTGETVSPDEFDLAAARTAINNGQDLDAWASNTADWVEDPVNSPAPPGTPEYSIALSTGTGGSGTPNPARVLMDEQAVFTLTPDTGYSLVSVTGCGGTLSGTTYTTAPINDVTAGNGDCSVTASFSINQYSVSYSAGTGGSLSGSTDQTVAHGDDADAVSAVADTGYSFTQWSDGVSTATRTDTNVTGDISATAQFVLNEYTLTYGAGTGGTLSGTSPQTVSHGSDGSSVTAVPDTGYTFSHWSDGVSTATRTDTNVTGDINVTAQFTLNQYTLTYSAGTSGSISGTSPQTVDHGSDGSSVTAVADTGYTFDQWSDGVTTATRTDTNVTGDITVTAQFTLNEYTLTYSAGSNGSISGTSPQIVSHGGDGSQVSAVPDSGYAFDQWSDGVATADRTDTNVTGDISVSAAFIPAAGTPDGVTAGGGDTDASISWNPVSGADSYNLYYATDSSVTPDNYNSLPGGTQVTGVTSTHTVTGLTNDTTYYFIVTAVQSGVEGSASSTVSATPEAPLTPWLTRLHEGRLQVDVRGPTKAIVDWPTASGETYNLYIANDPATDLNNYAAYGATLQTGVSPTVSLDNLPARGSIYIALEVNGTVSDWTSFRGRINGLDGRVYAQDVDGNGRRYIGGDFTAVERYTGSGVGLPEAGVTFFSDHALAFPEVNGQVLDVVSDGNGGWYIGGSFNSVGGKSRSHIAHINGQGNVTDWKPSTDNTVWAIEVVNGTIYIGGQFTSVSDSQGAGTRNRLAAFDSNGNLLPWNPGADNTVLDLAVSNGVIYAAGGFLAAGGGTGTSVRNRLAAFDGNANLLPWNPGANLTVESLVIANGNIYAGGRFSSVGGGSGNTPRNYLAAFDTSGAVLPWNPGANNYVYDIAVSSGTLYAGGRFTAAGGGSSAVPRNHLAAFDFNGDVLSWNPGADGDVYELTVANSLIYAGGYFTAVGGGSGTTPRERLAAFDGSGGVMPWNPGANSRVSAIALSDRVVYAGGSFQTAGVADETRENLAALDSAGNLLPWNPGSNGRVETILAVSNVVYAGGGFSAVGGGMDATARSRLAAFDSSGAVLVWNPGANGYVSTMIEYNGGIYVGGSFTQAGGGGSGTVTRNRLAAFDATGALLPWNPGADNVVTALAARNGTIYAGGTFVAAGGATGTMTRPRLAAFDTTGTVLPWNPGANDTVTSIVTTESGIYVGGGFTTAGSAQRDRLAAFDSTGAVLPWSPAANNVVRTLTALNGVIYVGGAFTQIADSAGAKGRQYLAAVDSSGKLQSWNPGAGSQIYTLVGATDVIYAGGSFSGVGGGYSDTWRHRIAAFDETGDVLNR